MRCIYCNHDKLYTLANSLSKCANCKRKFSFKKLATQKAILRCFCNNLSINRCAQELNLNYLTIQKNYKNYRFKIAVFMEEEFRNRKELIAYEEYLYLEKSKKGDKRAIFDAFNFLTFNFDNKIYNLLLPDLSRYKPAFLEDGLEKVYYKEFKKFLRQSHLKSDYDELIVKFWEFFEEFILKYKGVKRENFFYYLKEAEFKFNFECSLLATLMKM